MRDHSVVRVRGLQVHGDHPGGSGTVLDDISLDVGPAEVVGVVGRAGAGTSTLLGALAGNVVADRGEVQVLGWDPARDAGALGRRMSVLPSRGGLLDHLTVTESVQLWASLHDRPRDVTSVLELADLTAVRRVRVRRLGDPERQRLQLAVTFVGAAPLVVCDEPASGPRPGTATALAALARAHRDEGGTVITGSSVGRARDQLDDDLSSCWDRVAVLRRGRLVACAGAEELVEEFAAQGAASVVLTDAGQASALTAGVPGATFRRTGTCTRVDVPDCSADRIAALTAGLDSVLAVHHHTGALVDAVHRATADRRGPLTREDA